MSLKIPVLLYHSVSDDDPADSFSVSPGTFVEHIEAIVASCRTPLTMSELADGLRGLIPIPPSPVAVTFDDGYADSLAAIEGLRANGIKATLYVSTGQVSVGRGIPRADLQGLAQLDGVEIGAHGVTHVRLDEVAENLAQREIMESRSDLERMVGRPIDSFAYPHGAYDAVVRSLVIDAGFRSAAAVKNALSHDADDPWAIARWTVRRKTRTEDVLAFLDGDAPVATDRERYMTRAYRFARRGRRRLYPYTYRRLPSPFRDAVAPVAIRAFDLASAPVRIEPARSHTGQAYRSTAIFVRERGRPLGWVVFAEGSPDELSAEALRVALGTGPGGDAAVSSSSHTSRRAEQLFLSVVVTTCADAESTVSCVASILEAGVGAHEIIVVDNRPERSTVRWALDSEFGYDTRISCIDEFTRGLSSARNAGLRAAQGGVVAFVDDDVVVDRLWMQSIREAFASEPLVAGVTGMILPSELETAAQLDLERFAGFSKGFSRRVFSDAQPPPDVPIFPYAAGHFGSGANSAFRRDFLVGLGGFDPALGTGTPAHGAEDLDVYIRLIVSGGTLVYEPRAIVWHRHPDSSNALRRQAFSYGAGLGALIGKLLVSVPTLKLVRLAPTALIYLFSPNSRKNEGRSESFPAQLKRLELLGLAVGPFGYLASRLRFRGRSDTGGRGRVPIS